MSDTALGRSTVSDPAVGQPRSRIVARYQRLPENVRLVSETLAAAAVITPAFLAIQSLVPFLQR